MVRSFTRSSEFLNYSWPVVVLLLFGCVAGPLMPPAAPMAADAPIPTPAPSATPTPTLTPAPVYPWSDENAVMSGICFEAALDAAGRVFVLRGAEDHIRFYDQADGSRLCRRPVIRHPFDFSGGRILAGLWSAGRGCTARHDVIEIRRDDSARSLNIRLRFITEGGCDYELVRPFWIGLDGLGDYQVDIALSP